ncbi:putative C-C motif chemokine 21 isoform 2 [Scophthalmus maximus]|uniref:Chemokine (C-C motif) ligand 25a n=1 Tax=Scophthalmus maximus TaxID=52904 RepID=A0A2U9BIN3_SCOMX|nr:C-C motif chemokine 25 [Scophthalmus maximus]AWP03781.1 putative C-C motif chemokine 21 [Scophthalmus maximus]AWP03782.1 putative C-C motif chemokine 21 isoform 2 [Scophthalmus maximus]
MRFNVMILLLGTSCICLALAQVSYDDCCLKYAKKMSGNAQKHAVKYRRQEPDGGCNIPAVVFTMRKGRVLCADPREKWVAALMTAIDKKEAKDYGNKHQRRHLRPRFHRG